MGLRKRTKATRNENQFEVPTSISRWETDQLVFGPVANLMISSALPRGSKLIVFMDIIFEIKYDAHIEQICT